MGRGWQAENRLRRERLRFAALVLVPIVALFVAIRVGPIVSNLTLSFTNYRILRRNWRVVWLDNFSALFDHDGFWAALTNTLLFTAIAVPALIVLSLVIALLINRASAGAEPWFQAIYFLPFILPSVATTIIWKWIYAPGEVGLANAGLGAAGFAPVGWLTTPASALYSIIGLFVWKNFGLFVIVFLVGLKAIPREYREAALVDGASATRMVANIEIPLLRPQMVFAVVYATILSLSVFTEVYVMTQGADTTSAGAQVDVITTFLYREAFVYLNTARASAVSFVLFALVMAIIFLQMRLMTRGRP